MKNFLNEFKTFILRGNVMDMAVGIVIGAAFTAIVNSLVNDVIMPLISCIFGGTNFDKWNFVLRGSGENAVVLNLGLFIAAIINFLIVALIIFLVVKSINKLRDKVSKKEEEAPEAPTTKKCPFCLSDVPIAATKCGFCTSDLPDEEIPAE